MISPLTVDVGSVFGALTGLIDDLFTSDEERAAAKLRLMQLHQSGALAQLKVNANEASHKSLFVAGWRPFIGWVCGVAFAYNFVFYPLLQFGAWVWFQYGGVAFPVETLPVLDLSTMMPVLLGMLGLGAMRSFEKSRGIASERMDTYPVGPPPLPEGPLRHREQRSTEFDLDAPGVY